MQFSYTITLKLLIVDIFYIERVKLVELGLSVFILSVNNDDNNNNNNNNNNSKTSVMINFAFISVLDNSSQSLNVPEQEPPPSQEPLVKIHRNRGPVEVC